MGIEAWIVCYGGATLSNMVSGDKAQCSDQVCVVTLEEVLWSVTVLPQKTLIIAGLCMSYIKQSMTQLSEDVHLTTTILILRFSISLFQMIPSK